MNKLPAGWKLSQLEELATVERGKFSARPRNDPKFFDGDVPFVQTGDVSAAGTYLVSHKQTLNELGKTVSKTFPRGSILITIAANIGETAITTYEVACPDSVVAIIPKPAKAHVFWLKKVLETLKDDLDSKATQNAQKNINLEVLRPLEIVTPPIEEQTKIAQILSTWDKAIATSERLLANSQQQKQALLEPLLSGSKRFAGYPTWTRTAFSKLLTESRLPGSNGEIAKKITVKLYGKGVFAKDEKRIGSESTKYYRRRAGQFIYSKLDFLNGAFGIIPEHLDGYESTLDLPAFDFSELVEPAWLLQYVSREEFYTAQLGLANGGRKARRVNPADLLGIEILLPSLPEQQKIAQVLSTADAEIANLQAQLDKLKLEKKALMQQLLTGKRRVRLDDEEEDMAPIRRVG
ncbi:MAG: restriction endonuclease subunit S [Pseudomonas sp.]|uniref:restriction endonuclease subunit S n=1 Tax=Pseudomonas sp. TaxID=306 RepID=UPI003D0A9513